MIKTVGSICSGIEAASVAWNLWVYLLNGFLKLRLFHHKFLKEKFPKVPNLGDMNNIPDMLKLGKIEAPDLLCGGTPCQAFSFAGNQKGLDDERGNLTLKFVDIIKANDSVRKKRRKRRKHSILGKCRRCSE